MTLFGLADVVLRPRTAWGYDPGARALVHPGGECTYGELADNVLRLAAGLSAQGFRRGDAVAVLLKNRPEYFEVVFAVAHLGGVLVPLNYLLRRTEVEFIVRDSSAAWIFTEASLVDAARGVIGAEHDPVGILLDEPVLPDTIAYETLMTTEPAAAPPATVTSDEVLLLQYTSGTTGFPKGAVHTHGTVLFNALAQIVDFDVTAADVHVVVPSLSWAAGLHCLTLSVLWRGGTVVINPTGGFDAEQVCALIERHRVTSGMFAPSVLRLILDAGTLERYDMSSLRMVLSGGEPVTADEIAEFQRWVPGLSLHQGYGVSEFPSTMLHLGTEDVVHHGGAAGLSSISANVRVVDDAGTDVPVREHGEIVVRSPQSSTRYHGDHEDGAVADGWLRTGDRGFVDEGGFVHVAGRVKEMIISGGLNVYPAEVERVLGAHPDVVEVGVIGVPDRRFGEVGHAFVVVRDGAAVTEEELKSVAMRQLATFKVPRHWTLRAEPLPRTASGKIRRLELRHGHGLHIVR